MELSLNVLVGIILGIVLLSFGLIFTFKILKGADDIKKLGLPDTFEIEAESCVQRNDKVCMPEIKKTVETTKSKSFGTIINNILGRVKSFKIIVKYSIGTLKDGSNADSQDEKKWTFADYEQVSIKNNEYTIVEIPMRVPSGTRPGTYVFNVNVCFDDSVNPSTKCPGSHPSLYSPTQQITIDVV